MVKKYEIQRVWGEDVLNEIDLLVFILIFYVVIINMVKQSLKL